MTETESKDLQNYLENFIEWLILEKGAGALKIMDDDELFNDSLEEYNAAYERFVIKFLSAPRDAKKEITESIMRSVYTKLKSKSIN